MAITRLSVDGYGARRAGSFAGRAEVVAEEPTPRLSGGGRVFGYFPEAPKKKKHKVELKWTDERESELIKRLKAIDDDYEKKRRKQFDELLMILRSAVHLANQVSFSGFDYLSPEDIKKAKRKVQIEEENTIILSLLTGNYER